MDDEQSLEFGAELAQARAQRGMSLEEVARRTKIGIDALKAIERGDVATLPGGLYTRAFLRAYAHEVGCDPDDIVRRYREKFKDRESANAIAQLDVGVNVTCAPGQVHVKDIDAMTRRRSRTAWFLGVVVVLLGTAIHFSLTPTTSWRSHRDQARSLPKPETTSTGAAVPAPSANAAVPPAPPVGTSGAPSAADVAHPTDDSAPVAVMRLEVKPSGACWLSATADGQRVLYRLLDAGERTQIEAHDEVTLLVGDPATCAFDINGTDVRQLGAPGQPVTVHFTKQNFQQYLVRPATDQQPVTLP